MLTVCEPEKITTAALSPREIKLLVALVKADALFRAALPHVNWHASSLDRQSIALLNEVPKLVARVIDEMMAEEKVAV